MKSGSFGVVATVRDGNRPTMTVAVTGEFDASRVRAFEVAVTNDLSILAELVIDLGATTIIDSSALGVLVRTCERAAEAQIAYSTLVERPFQRKLLQVTGLLDVLHVVGLDD